MVPSRNLSESSPKCQRNKSVPDSQKRRAKREEQDGITLPLATLWFPIPLQQRRFSLRLFSFAHHSKNPTRTSFLAGFLPSLHTVAPEQRDGSSLSSSTHPCMADQPNLGSLHVRYGEGFNKFRTSFFLQSQGRMGVEAGQGTAVPKWPQRAGGDKPAEDKRAATAGLTRQPHTRLMAQVGVGKSETLGGLAAGSITPKLQPSASRGSQTFKELALL